MSKLAYLLAATALVTGFVPSVHAADYAAPKIGAPSMIPEEIGTGWYLRGDVGYGVPTNDLTMRATKSGYNLTNPSANNIFSAGGGFGYRLNEYFRMDFTADWAADQKAHWKVTGTCTGQSCAGGLGGKADLAITPLLISAYADLGNWAGFSPYIGAGVGFSIVQVDQPKYFDPVTDRTLVYSTGKSTPLTAAGMAGFGYDLGGGATLDIGYRYLWIDTFKTGRAVVTDPTTKPATKYYDNGVAKFEDFSMNQLRLGVRYTIN
jgi:opacity protein-like surface antigen